MYLAGTRLNHSAKASLLCIACPQTNRFLASSAMPNGRRRTGAPSGGGRQRRATARAGGTKAHALRGAQPLREGGYESQVVHQFVEIARRYAGDVLIEARALTTPAGCHLRPNMCAWCPGHTGEGRVVTDAAAPRDRA